MRVFEHPNMTNFQCPICKTSDDKPVVLVGIAGTEEDGNIEAKQFHLDCIELIADMDENRKVLYQRF